MIAFVSYVCHCTDVQATVAALADECPVHKARQLFAEYLPLDVDPVQYGHDLCECKFCRARDKRRRRPDTHLCPACGAIFTRNRDADRYCSTKCRLHVHRAQKEGAVILV